MDPDEAVRLQFRCTVPRWVVDSLKHEAAKERRSVANLLAMSRSSYFEGVAVAIVEGSYSVASLTLRC
jgi:hypothetical protein